MKQLLTIFTLCLAFSSASAQNQKEKLDYDKKTGIVSTETGPVFKVLEERSAQLSTAKDYTIQNLEGKPLIILAWNDFEDARQRSQSNSTGRVIYYEVTFLNEKRDKVEISHGTFMTTMRQIYNSNLIKDGKLNPEAVDIFVIKNGNKFSIQRATAK